MNFWEAFKEISNSDWENKIKKDLKIDSIEGLKWVTPYGLINPISNFDQKLITGNSSKFNELCWKFDANNCTNNNVLSCLKNGINAINIINSPLKEDLFENVMNNIIFNNILFDHNLNETDQKNWIKWINADQTNKGSLRIDSISSALNESLILKHKINFNSLILTSNQLTNQNFSCLFIDAVKYGDFFTDINLEIAFTIAHINESIEIYNKIDIPIPDKLILKISTSADFLQETSKIRALKALIIQVLKVQQCKMEIQFETSYKETILSPTEKENNLLRLTTGFISSIISGVNGIELNDNLSIKKGDYWKKIIANIPIILVEESQLNSKEDKINGAHVIEQMSYKMAQQSWLDFKDIESKGGLLKYAKDGLLKEIVSKQQTKKYNEIKNESNKIIGFNHFTKPNIKPQNDINLNLPFYLSDLI